MGLTRLRAEQISDIDYKQAVRVIATTNIANLNGGAPSTVDGVGLARNDRILVKAQDTASQNGLYYVTTLGTGSNGVWQRTLDGNETGEIQSGMIVMVTEGDSFKDTQWKLTTNNPIVIGTTPLTFELNTSTNQISNGNSSITISTLGGNANVSIGGVANVAVFTATGLSANNISTDGNLVVGNNLVVNGNLTYVNVTDLNVEDPIIGLGRGPNNSPLTTDDNKDRGTQLWYYTDAERSAFVGWDDSSGKLVLASNVSISNEIVTVNNYGNLLTGNIDTTGNILPTANVTYDLGSSSARWKDIWLSNSSIYMGTVTVATVGNALTVNGANVLTGNSGFNFNTTGNITGGNLFTSGLISASGNATAAYFIGNGSSLSSITGSNVTGTVANATYATSAGTATTATTADTVTSNAQANITSVGTLTGLNVNGTVSATGNITGNYFIGNGSQLTGLPAQYSNANVQSYLSAFGSNTISTTGNITAGYFLGDGSQLTNLPVQPGTYSNSNVSLFLANLGSNTINGTGNITTTANISGNYILGNGSQLTGLPPIYNDSNVTTLLSNLGPNTISGSGNITTTANISGNYILGNGSQLTGLPESYNNSNVTTLLANLGSNVISGTGNITTTANISGNYILGNGSQLTGLPITYSDANVVSLLSNFGSNTILTSGNITGGNLLTSGAISATSAITSAANITGGNLLTGGQISSGGNVLGSNLLTSGNVSASGNVNATTVVATNLTGTLTTAAQTNITLLGTLSSLSVLGNTQSGNLKTIGVVSAAGNITGGNLITTGNLLSTGLISATGNVIGNYFIGNGSQLTGITAAVSSIDNGTSNVTIPTANGNISMNTAGQETVEVSPGELTVYGVFSNPKTITSNVVIGPNINSMLIGPIAVDPNNNIFVPTGSTLNII